MDLPWTHYGLTMNNCACVSYCCAICPILDLLDTSRYLMNWIKLLRLKLPKGTRGCVLATIPYGHRGIET